MGGMLSKAAGSGTMGVPVIDTGHVTAMGERVTTHVGTTEMAVACGTAVTNMASKIPEPIAKIGVILIGNNVCRDVGPEGKVGSQPPPERLKGPDGTT